jgi:predicted Zn-dependent protease
MTSQEKRAASMIKPLRFLLRSAVSVLLAVAFVSVGCSLNPATGGRQLILIGEEQEMAMGREAHEDIVATMGVYPDDAVQDYVDRLGKELAALSERPSLPWTFTVIDDPVVNAFALPGGFIYVTRGILTHLNSEAELVSVLGHEIGHVTARHSVSRMSKAQLANLGLGIGMVVSPEFRHFGDLAQQSLELLFLKFSRDDERQADDLGLRYTVRGGWDAREMPKVFAVLKRVSEVAGAGRLPNWLATHPDPEARQERIGSALAAVESGFAGARIERSGFLARVDGMVFGENPREGFFEGSAFLHPDLEFRLDFPEGWRFQNQKQSVGGLAPNEDAVAMLTLDREADVAKAARAFSEQEGVRAGRVERGRIHGLPAARVDFEVPREQGSGLRGQVAFARYGDNTYRLLGYTLSEKWGTYRQPIDRFIRSFRRLQDRRALSVQPARVRIVEPRTDLTLQRFQTRFPSTVPLETVGLINHVAADGVLKGGQEAKQVVVAPALSAE